MTIFIAAIAGFVVGASTGYGIWYAQAAGMRRRADARLQRKLDSISLRVDLIVEGIGNIVDPPWEGGT